MKNNIDEIYNDRETIKKSIESMTWTNARVKHVFVGYEGHGLLTVSISFEGDGWSQGFHNRNLGGPGNAFKNFIQGWLKVGTIESSKGMPVRIGRVDDSIFGSLLAVRPIIDSGRVFWPGGDASRFYVFDCDGSVMDVGL